MNEKRSIENCMFQVLKEEEINLARKEGAITFCKSLIERFEKERIVLENERIVLEKTMRQNHYTDLDFSNAQINIGKLLQLKKVLKELHSTTVEASHKPCKVCSMGGETK